MPRIKRLSIIQSTSTMLMTLYMASCTADPNFQKHKTVHYSKELTETHLTVTGKATNADFVNMDVIYIENYKALPRERGGIEMPRGFYSTELDKTKIYTYDIYRKLRQRQFEETPAGWIDYRISSEIFKIRLDDRIIWDGSICQLHHCKMKRVCVSLDDSDYNFKHQEAMRTRFPHARATKVNGDYVVWLCPECVIAEKQWRLQQ